MIRRDLTLSLEVAADRRRRRALALRLTGPGTVESDLQMTTEIQGYRIQTNTRTTGKRLGPFKS